MILNVFLYVILSVNLVVILDVTLFYNNKYLIYYLINKKNSLHIKGWYYMKNFYQQQLIDFYMKQCESLYSSKHMYPGQYVNMLEVLNNTGFVRLNIYDQIERRPISNATITIYVTDGVNRDIPIMHLITTLNPVRIELPMANELGTTIIGPEYSFSTYNIRIDAFSYISNNVLNVRLFPNTTTNYEIAMIPVSHIQEQPVKIEERIDLPPHQRDVLS